MLLANDSEVLTLSAAARARILSHCGEPLFVADRMRVLMIHFEVAAEALRRDVPFELDLRDGRAFVSLVAFTMRGMRPRIGGKLAAWLFRPLATHDFSQRPQLRQARWRNRNSFSGGMALESSGGETWSANVRPALSHWPHWLRARLAEWKIGRASGGCAD